MLHTFQNCPLLWHKCLCQITNFAFTINGLSYFLRPQHLDLYLTWENQLPHYSSSYCMNWHAWIRKHSVGLGYYRDNSQLQSFEVAILVEHLSLFFHLPNGWVDLFRLGFCFSNNASPLIFMMTFEYLAIKKLTKFPARFFQK